MMNETDLLTAANIATRLGVTSGRIYQLIAAGVIPATRIGRSIRIPRPAWEAWLQQQTELALRHSEAKTAELEVPKT